MPYDDEDSCVVPESRDAISALDDNSHSSSALEDTLELADHSLSHSDGSESEIERNAKDDYIPLSRQVHVDSPSFQVQLQATQINVNRCLGQHSKKAGDRDLWSR